MMRQIADVISQRDEMCDYLQESLNESRFWTAMIFRAFGITAERINVDKDAPQAKPAWQMWCS